MIYAILSTAMKRRAAASLLALVLPLLSQAATLHVPGHFWTIQNAIDWATIGDEIIVAPGTYHERINFKGKNLNLHSLDPTNLDLVKATVVDAQGSGGPVVSFAGTETEACVLAGFTITGGSTEAGSSAGGISGNGCKAVIRWNVVELNEGYPGGGIGHCDGVIEQNAIRRNIGDQGGGLYACGGKIQDNWIDSNTAFEGGGLSGCGGWIRRNVITDNEVLSVSTLFSTGTGGGLSGCGGTIENNVICYNYCDGGGGGMYWCRGTIRNNTLYRNSASDLGGAMLICNNVSNCIIYRNTSGSDLAQLRDVFPVSYCLIDYRDYLVDWDGSGVGNIETNPRWANDLAYDFSLAPDSPCIDAGRNVGLADDLMGNPRPYDSVAVPRGDGSNYDIGAVEFIGSATPDSPPHRPVNLDPPDGAERVHYLPTLTASAFVDDNTQDNQLGGHWQISEETDFASLAVDEEVSRLSPYHVMTSFAVTESNQLSPSTPYYWRVSYRDGYLNWSEWSEPTSFTTRGTIIYVPTDYPTIQKAIDAAISGIEVVVLPGTYNEPVNLKGKPITLRSTNPDDPAVVDSTIIQDHAVTFNGAEGSNCTLSGLTITNTKGRGIEGNYTFARIEKNRISNNADAGIYHCIGLIRGNRVIGNQSTGIEYSDGRIEGNTLSGNAGYAIFRCNGTIVSNLISDNLETAVYDCNGQILSNQIQYNHRGAIWESTAVIKGNIVSFNIHPEGGAGIFACAGTIESNLVQGNDSPWTSGLAALSGTVRNNLVVGNRATVGSHAGVSLLRDGNIQGNTIYGNSSAGQDSGGIDDSPTTAIIRNNIVWGNLTPDGVQIANSGTPTYCCIQNWTSGGTGNISLDPLFVDPVHKDFRLRPDSPCIDIGAHVEGLVEDLAGNPRPRLVLDTPGGDGSGFDVGALEFYGSLAHPSDVYYDGYINWLDLFQFQADWFFPSGVDRSTNVNHDTRVDSLDLLLLVEDWYSETGPSRR